MEEEGKELLEMVKSKGVVPEESKMREVLKNKRGCIDKGFPMSRGRCTSNQRYEAWVIYNFLSLLAWVGGPGAVVLSLSGRVLKPNWCLMTCCFPPVPLDGMLIAAFAHLYAFPYKEYAGANIGPSRGFCSLGHALMLNDFYHDTVHQFAPTYHDYVLYNHGDSEEGLEDVQLSELLSPSANNNNPQNPGAGQLTGKSEAMNYSLLMDASTNVSAPYDLSLIDVDISNYPSKVPAANPGSR
ncbi:hypothetical protein HAX54_047616 [Datura stramonium]|uniref:Uncharacterized protein n=1 Tax=Datura stramonium TaxID=4076 RepID=A0ABS8WL90_DATST|nr:hypothetical protein [Datura stramonium]